MIHLPRRRPRLPALLAVAAFAPALLLAACSDDDGDDDVTTGAEESPGATDTTTGGGAADDGYGGVGTDGATAEGAAVRAVDFQFELVDDTVASGAELTFANDDSVPHTMTADDGAFDSGRVEGGDRGSVTAPAEPGDYPFHCEIHPEMQATLTVEG